MAHGSQKRITKELAELLESPPSGITVALADESNLYRWKVVMEGPANSPFAGGTFNLILTLPPQYPFRPPSLTFATKIYHPNISSSPSPTNNTTSTSTTETETETETETGTGTGTGMMCLGMLRPEEWKPPTRISAVLDFARQLLREPNPDDAVETAIADEMRSNRSGWEREAREWTRRYATPAPAPAGGDAGGR